MGEAPATVEVVVDHRRRLLDGLAASIREKGLTETQVSDVVRHARASRRTFYNAFPDKDAAFLALAQELSGEVYERVALSVDATLGWEEQIDRTIETYLTALAEDRAMTITFAVELATLGAAGQALRRAALGRYADFVTELTRSEPMRRAGVRPVSRDTAIMLIGGINELVSLAVAEGRGPESVAATVRESARALLAPAGT